MRGGLSDRSRKTNNLRLELEEKLVKKLRKMIEALERLDKDTSAEDDDADGSHQDTDKGASQIQPAARTTVQSL